MAKNNKLFSYPELVNCIHGALLDISGNGVYDRIDISVGHITELLERPAWRIFPVGVSVDDVIEELIDMHVLYTSYYGCFSVADLDDYRIIKKWDIKL